MNPHDPNVQSVEAVAQALGELCEELVLVGGCAVGLLLTSPAAPPPRATKDVDVVAAVTTLAQYHALKDVCPAGLQTRYIARRTDLPVASA